MKSISLSDINDDHLLVRVFWSFLFIVISAAFTYSSIFYKNLPPEPYGFLFNPAEHFSDFIENLAFIKHNDPYFKSEAWHIAFYPPGGFLAIKILKLIGITSYKKWIVFNYIIVLGVIICHCIREKITPTYTRLLYLLFLLANPAFLFAIDRGNMESVVLIIIVASFLERSAFTSGLLMGLAVAIKIWPAVFFLVFLQQGRRAGMVAMLISFLMFTSASLFSFDSDILPQLHEWIKNISTWSSSRLLSKDIYEAFSGLKRDILPDYTVDLWDAIRMICLNYDLYTTSWVPYFTYKTLIFILVSISAYNIYKANNTLSSWYIAACIAIISLPLTYFYRIFIVEIILIICSMRHAGGLKNLIPIYAFICVPFNFLQYIYPASLGQIYIPFSIVLLIIHQNILMMKAKRLADTPSRLNP